MLYIDTYVYINVLRGRWTPSRGPTACLSSSWSHKLSATLDNIVAYTSTCAEIVRTQHRPDSMQTLVGPSPAPAAEQAALEDAFELGKDDVEGEEEEERVQDAFVEPPAPPAKTEEVAPAYKKKRKDMTREEQSPAIQAPSPGPERACVQVSPDREALARHCL